MDTNGLERIRALGISDKAERSAGEPEREIPYVSDPRVAAIQFEADTARTMRDACGGIATGILKRMNVGSQEDQIRLKREGTDALREEREWTEKHLAALEKLVAILDGRKH